MNLLTLTFKNLWSHRLRFALTVLGVGTSIAAFVSLVGLIQNLEDTLKMTYQTRGTDLIVVERGTADILASMIDQATIDKIRTLPDVNVAGAIVVDFQALKFKQYALVYGWEPGSYLYDELKIQGHKPMGVQEAIIGAMAAKRFSKKIGDAVTLKGKSFTLVGIYKSGSVLEEGGIILPLETLQTLRKASGKVTMLNISVRKDKSRVDLRSGVSAVIGHLRQQIENDFPGVEVKSVEDFIATATPVSTAFNFTWAITVVAFLIAILGIMNTMMTSVLERSRDIGILRAIGWRPSKIMLLVLLEAVLIGLCGGGVGLVIGYGLMKAMAALPHLQGVIRIVVDTKFMAQVVLSSVVLGFVAGLYPAARAILINPLEVLRYE
jgi:putative ABC transport system permease protein